MRGGRADTRHVNGRRQGGVPTVLGPLAAPTLIESERHLAPS